MTRAFSRRRFMAAAALGAGSLPLACAGGERPGSLTPAPAPPPAHPGGVLRWTLPAPIDTLDPHTASYGGGFAASLLYDTLFRFRPAGDPGLQVVEPYLAASFEQPEPTRLLLRLQPAARFHSRPPVGARPVVADDVVFSLRRLTGGRPGFIHRGDLEPLTEVQAIAEDLVGLRLAVPYAPLLAYLSTPWPAIMPHELLELGVDLRSTAIGSGPYRLDRTDEVVELVRAPDWWRRSGDSGFPNIDRIQLEAVPGGDARLDRLLRAEGDWCPFVPFERAGELAAGELSRGEFPLQDFQHIRLNLREPRLRDPRVRRALSLAIDRAAVVGEAFGGRGVSHGVLPPAVRPWALAPEQLPYYSHDPEQATALLRAAGLEDGLRITNLAPQATPLQNAYTAVVRSQWAAVGVDLVDRPVPYAEYLEQARARNFEVNVHWGNRYDEVDGYLSEFRRGGPRNFGGWGDEETDTLIAQQRAELDGERRHELVARIQTAVAENAWLIGVASWTNTDAWTARLRDTQASAEPFSQTRWLGESWLQA